jgi:hypothetical protein
VLQTIWYKFFIFIAKMSTTETDQPVGVTLEEVAGFYLFTLNEKVVYRCMVAASEDLSRTPKQRRNSLGSAVKKLRKVIEERMPEAEKLELEANKQAAANLKQKEKEQRDNRALSLCTPKQKESYDVSRAGATDPAKTRAEKAKCAQSAADKLSRIVAKQVEKDKRATMTAEELEEYNNNPERVAKNTHTALVAHARAETETAMLLAGDADTIARKEEKARRQQEYNAKCTEKEAALRRAGDPDALARQAAKNEVERKRYAAERQ